MKIIPLIFKTIALAMGVSTLVLSLLGNQSTDTAIMLLSIGLASLAIVQLEDK